MKATVGGFYWIKSIVDPIVARRVTPKYGSAYWLLPGVDGATDDGDVDVIAGPLIPPQYSNEVIK
jgi:hypothetical protein